MDKNLIEHINTGQSTHRYLVKKGAAEEFKYKMDNDPLFMIKYRGMFTSRPIAERKPCVPYEVSLIDNEEFADYVKKRWKDYPTAISVNDVVGMVGHRSDFIIKMVSEGILYGTKVNGTWYILKDDVIKYALSEKYLLGTFGESFKAVIREYRKRKCRERENEKRREKRAAEREAKDNK